MGDCGVTNMCWRNNMVSPLCFTLIFVLVLQCVQVHTQNNVGCLFSPTVCDIEEDCFDDSAFGRCQFPYSPDVDNYRHLIGSETTKLLEKELTRLFAGGYRWRHKYTQCVIQNILYTNRHRISYDPGLCSRVMHSSLPNVPPEIVSDLESPEPDELAYIKFKPNRDDPESAMYADEIYNPPVDIGKDIEVKETIKRSTRSMDDNDWITNDYDGFYDQGDVKYPKITDKESLFRKLLEAADETGKLFEEFQTKSSDRYPDDDLPVIRTELSSDLNQRPMFSEGGTSWIPVNENNDYLSENDIIDTYDKKRVRDILDNNDIIRLDRPPYNTVKFLDESYDGPLEKDPSSDETFLDKEPYNDIKFLKKEPYDGEKFEGKEPYDGAKFQGKEPYDGVKYRGKETYDGAKFLGKEAYDGSKFLGKEAYDGAKFLGKEQNVDEKYLDKDLYNGLKFLDKTPQRGVTLLGNEQQYTDDSKETNMLSSNEDPGYEAIQLDDEDQNFRWNYKHINRGIDNDITRFSRGHKDGRSRVIEPKETKNINDVIEDDYLEDQLYAILPVDNGMATFSRYDTKRYDIKKPGPNFMIHEDEDGDTTHDDEEMAVDGARALISRLSKTAREDQLLALLKTPVVAQKSSTLVVPSREVIEAAQRIVVTGVSEIPSNLGKDLNNKQSSAKQVERLHADQPGELIEGIDDLTSKDVKDEVRMANAAQTGEGHIGHFDTVDATHAYVRIKEKDQTEENANKLVETLGSILNLPKGSFSDVRIKGQQITFKVNTNTQNLNASDVAAKAEEQYVRLKELTGITVESAGIGDKVKYEVVDPSKERYIFAVAVSLCGGVAGIMMAVAAAYFIRERSKYKEKLQNVPQVDTEPSQDYQDLCRQRMASKSNDKPENIHSTVHSPKKIRSLSQEGQASSSSHSSTSSWNEEPVTSNMDISTGHIILAYMEDHLKNKDRLDREWEGLCAYEAELCSITTSSLPQNIKKNRYTDVLPYDHSRVLLTEVSNVASSDYINASSITDHDPRNPAYIATQGPLPQTAADFWQMIWEQGSVVIVMLSRLMENGVAMCHRYWPEEGSEVYHIYEVHLVSEHIWCDDYLVRSFYLKNLRTNETRTVTQFHFMSWPDNGVPNSTKALLEFRRKVNKSYRGRSCPIVVHCSDGIGRTGTYCLIDMVLNRMAKGAKEIDIAATLEHVRDQRAGMVKTKTQFEFVLMAIAEEVHAILKALSQ